MLTCDFVLYYEIVSKGGVTFQELWMKSKQSYKRGKKQPLEEREQWLTLSPHR